MEMPYKDEFGNDRGETMLPEYDGAFSFHLGRYAYANSFSMGGKVLDVGCGIGYGSVELLKKHSSYVGFDVYEMRKQRAEKSYSNINSTFLVHDANNPFPFKDEEFDTVVCFEAIEHVKDDYACVKEIHRVLKHRGVFVCSTPKYGFCKTITGEIGIGHYHQREYTEGQFRKLFQSCFLVEKTTFYGQNYGCSFIPGKLDEPYFYCVVYK